jgi:L-rhamnose mutarotase
MDFDFDQTGNAGPNDGNWKPQPYTGGGLPTSDGRRRLCFIMQFNPAVLPQYLKAHESVWPDMQKVLHRSGWHNYSMFYRKDGLAVGYFETYHSNFDEAYRAVEAEEATMRWQEAMAKYTAAGVNSGIRHAVELKQELYISGASPSPVPLSGFSFSAPATTATATATAMSLPIRSEKWETC